MRSCIDKKERMILGGDFHLGIRNEKNKRLLMNNHNHQGVHEIICCFEGSFRHTINGKDFIQHEGEVVFIREQDYHELDFYNCVVANIAFCSELFSDIINTLDDGSLKRHILIPHLPKIWTLPDYTLKKLVSSFFRMTEKHNNGIDLMQFKRFLINLLLDIYVPDNPYQSDLPVWLNKAIVNFKKLPVASLEIDQLVKLSSRSREHVCRSLKKYMNKSPSQLINEIKLKKSRHLLISTNMSITDVAYEAGFNSLNYFFKLFHNKYKISPKNFRRKHEL